MIPTKKFRRILSVLIQLHQHSQLSKFKFGAMVRNIIVGLHFNPINEMLNPLADNISTNGVTPALFALKLNK